MESREIAGFVATATTLRNEQFDRRTRAIFTASESVKAAGERVKSMVMRDHTEFNCHPGQTSFRFLLNSIHLIIGMRSGLSTPFRSHWLSRHNSTWAISNQRSNPNIFPKGNEMGEGRQTTEHKYLELICCFVPRVLCFDLRQCWATFFCKRNLMNE